MGQPAVVVVAAAGWHARADTATGEMGFLVPAPSIAQCYCCCCCFE